MPLLRRQCIPDENFPVRHAGKPLRLFFRRAFLRGRFSAFAVPLRVTGTARRSPGARDRGRLRIVSGGVADG
jgi:hypothetical protein